MLGKKIIAGISVACAAALLLCLVAWASGNRVWRQCVPASSDSSLSSFAVSVKETSPSDTTTSPLRLPVPSIFQLPELPNGCEVTSLAMVLNYFGYPANKVDLAESYLPRQEFVQTRWGDVGGDPFEVYPGDPGESGWGFYCYPPVLLQTAENYLATQRAAHAPADVSGVGREELIAYLDKGLPVIVWKTTDNELPRRSDTNIWLLNWTEEVFIPYVNIHVLVLCGYDDVLFYFCDPLGNEESLPQQEFMKIYKAVGSYALLLEPAELKTPFVPSSTP